jgi:hypothetical protein
LEGFAPGGRVTDDLHLGLALHGVLGKGVHALGDILSQVIFPAVIAHCSRHAFHNDYTLRLSSVTVVHPSFASPVLQITHFINFSLF